MRNDPTIIIHRGTRSIGGTCIEISSDGHRLIIDLGVPIAVLDGAIPEQDDVRSPTIENGVLPDIDGLYASQAPSVDAVILSHPHLDHYGLMDSVHPDIPIYVGRESHALIEMANIFHPPDMTQKRMIKHCREFEHWKPFEIGPFAVTSYLMDHSAFGSSALNVAVGGKNVFYTGDLRAHGRKAKLFDRLVSNPIKAVDCMICDGTTVGNSHDAGFPTEQAVEDAMHEVFANQQDASFVTAAGSNIDRLVSIYKAVKRAGKTLVLDLYQVCLLEQLQEFAPGLPPHPEDEIRVLYIGKHCNDVVNGFGKEKLYKYRSRKINEDEILGNRRNMVLRLPLSRMKRLAGLMRDRGPLDNSRFVYSMWPGYLERDDQFTSFVDEYGVQLIPIHTSGHAYLKDLKRLADAISPRVLLPAHTLAGDQFKDHFENVLCINDGEPLVLN